MLIEYSEIKQTTALLISISLLLQSVQTSGAYSPSVVRPSTPIYLIQDIHQHVEAQKSIEETIRKLQKKLGQKMIVGVEGAAGEFQLKHYQQLPNASLSQQIVSELVDQKLVSGPVEAAFLDADLTLKGLEDPDLYRANVEAYRSATQQQNQVEKLLQQEKNSIQKKKQIIFPPALLHVDALSEGFHAGRLSLTDYLFELEKGADSLPWNLEIYLETSRMEKTLPWSHIEAEKNKLLKKLSFVCGSEDMAWITELSIKAKEEEKVSSRFDMLLHTALSKGIRIDSHSSLYDYLRYLKLTEAIQADKLFSELIDWEREKYRGHDKYHPEVDSLIEASFFIRLAEKLIHFELTPDEWAAYKRHKENMLTEASRFLLGHLASYEKFYHLAETRNESLANESLSHGVQAIVVGGFHTPGLQVIFEKKGRTVKVIRPRVTRLDLDGGTAYLSVFTSEKTPLQKWLLKWKLFLAPPASLGVEPLVATQLERASVKFERSYLRRISHRWFEKSRLIFDAMKRDKGRKPWLYETSYFLPLSFGIGQSNPFLILMGLIVAYPLFLMAHQGQKLQKERALWAQVFLGSYLVTYIGFHWVGNLWTPLASALSLLSPLLIHALNTFMARHPNGKMTRWIVRGMGLSPVPMNIEESQDNAEIEKIIADLKTAVANWKQEKKHDQPGKRKQGGDNVIGSQLFGLAIKCLTLDSNAKKRVTATLSELYTQLTDKEIDVRIYQDQLFFFNQNFNQFKGQAEERKQRPAVSQFYQDLLFASVVQRNDEKFTKKVLAASMDAITDHHTQVMKKALKMTVSDENDKEFFRLWEYLASDACEVNYGTDEANKNVRAGRLQAIVKAWTESPISSEFFTHRYGYDAAFGRGTFGEETPLIKFIEASYSAIFDYFLKKNNEEMWRTARRKGAALAIQIRMKRLVQANYMARNVDDVSPFIRLNQTFFDIVNLVPSEIERDELFVAGAHGFREGLLGLSITDQQLKSYMKQDFESIWKPVVENNVNAMDAYRSMVFSSRAMTYVLNAYSGANRDIAYKEQLKTCLTDFTREATKKVIQFYLLMSDDKEFPYDPLFIFPFLYQHVVENEELSEENIINAVEESYLDFQFTEDQFRLVIRSELKKALPKLHDVPYVGWHIKVLLEVYWRLGERMANYKPLINEEVNALLDTSGRYRDLVAGLIASREEDHAVKSDEYEDSLNQHVTFLFLKFVLFPGPWMIQIRQKMIAALISLDLTRDHLKHRIAKDVEYAMSVKNDSTKIKQVNRWARLVLERMVLAITEFIDELRDQYISTQNISRAAIVSEVIDLRKQVVEEFSNAIALWRLEENHEHLDTQQDPVTELMETYAERFISMSDVDRKIILTSIAMAYRQAQLTPSEIETRIYRDIKVLVIKSTSWKRDQAPFAMFGFTLYRRYGHFFIDEEPLIIEKNLQKALNEAVPAIVSTGVALWREGKGDGALRSLFSILENFSKGTSERLMYVQELLGQALMKQNLTGEEWAQRAATDIADSSSLQDSLDARTLARSVYLSVAQKLGISEGTSWGSLTGYLTKGMLGAFSELTKRATLDALRSWDKRHTPPKLVLDELIKNISRLLSGDRRIIGAKDLLKNEFAKGFLAAITELQLSADDVRLLYKNHMAFAFADYYQRKMESMEYLDLVDYLFIFAREELGDCQREVFVTGARSILNAEFGYYRPDLDKSPFMAIDQTFRHFGFTSELKPDLFEPGFFPSSWSDNEKTEYAKKSLDRGQQEARQSESGKRGYALLMACLQKCSTENPLQAVLDEHLQLDQRLQTALKTWVDSGSREKNHLQSKDDSSLLNVLIDYFNLAQIEPDKENFWRQKMMMALFNSTLSPDELRFRAQTDLKKMGLAHLASEYVVDGDLNYSELSSKLTNITFLYFDLTMEHAKRGNHEQVNALLAGIFLGITDLKRTVLSEVKSNEKFPKKIEQQLNEITRYLLTEYAKVCLKCGFPLQGQQAMKIIKMGLNPSPQAIGQMRDLAFLNGRLYHHAGKELEGLWEGTMATLAMDQRSFERQIDSVSHVVDHILNIVHVAGINFVYGFYEDAYQFASNGIDILNRHPSLINHLPPHTKRGLETLQLASQFIQDADETITAQRLDSIERNLLTIMQEEGPQMAGMTKSRWGVIQIDVLKKACVLGKRNIYDRMISIAGETFDSRDPHPLLIIKAEGLLRLSKTAHSELKKQQLIEAKTLIETVQPWELVVQTFTDVDLVMAYAAILFEQRDFLQAIQCYEKLLQALNTETWPNPGEGEIAPDAIFHFILIRRINILLARAYSLTNKEDAKDKTIESLKSAFVHFTNKPMYPDAILAFPDTTEGYEIFLKSIENIMMENGDGVTITMRTDLLKHLSRWRAGKEFYDIHQQEWADQLTKFKPKQEAKQLWTPRLKAIIKKTRNFQLTNFDPPASQLAQQTVYEQFELICRRMDIHFNKLLELPEGNLWAHEFNKFQSQYRFEASVYALLGYEEEAIELLNYIQHLREMGLKKFRVRLITPPIDDLYVMFFSMASGMVVKGVELAILRFVENKNEAIKDELRSHFFWGLDRVESFEWPNEKSMAKSLEAIVTFLQANFNLSNYSGEATQAKVLNRLSRLFALLGKSDESRAQMKKVVEESKEVTFEGAVAILNWIPFIMRDRSMGLSSRIDDAMEYLEPLADDASPIFPHVQYRQLLLELMEGSSDRTKMKQLCQRYIDFVQNENVYSELPTFIGLGLAHHMVQAAYLAGPPSIEAQDLIKQVIKLRDEWVGAKSTAFITSAMDFYTALVSGNTGAFIENTSTLDNKVLGWPAFKNLWCFTAVYQEKKNHSAPIQHEVWSDPLVLGLRRLVEEKVTYYFDSYHVDGINELLMESPLGREAFIETVLVFLGQLGANDWKNTQEDKTRETFLKNLITVSSHLGDDRLFLLFEKLVRDSQFPHNQWLKGTYGVLVQMEPGLSIETWLKRFDDAKSITHNDAVALVRAARRRIATASHADADQLIEKIREFINERRQSKNLAEKLSVIRQACGQWDLSRALAVIQEIPQTMQTDEIQLLNSRIETAQHMLKHYFKMEFQKVLSLSADVKKEPSLKPICDEFQNRINKIMQARTLMESRQPHLADNLLRDLNPALSSTEDPILKGEKEKIQRTLDEFSVLFQKIKDLCEGLTSNPRSIENVADLFKKLQDIEENIFFALNYLLTQVEILINSKEYRLAQNMVRIIFLEGQVWQKEQSDKSYAEISQKAERLRQWARAYEMRDWVEPQSQVLRLHSDAIFQLEYNDKGGGSTFRGKRFKFDALWEITSSGMLVIKNLWQLRKQDKFVATGDRSEQLEKVKVRLRELNLPPGLNFIIMMNVGDKTFRIPLTFVKTFEDNRNGDRLYFQPDNYGLEQLKTWTKQTEKPSGYLLYVEDQQIITQAIALERVTQYLNMVIKDLQANSKPRFPEPLLDRLFGLTIESADNVDVPKIELLEKFERDSSQKSAIYAVVESMVTAIQGPPGTGKTSTAAEAYRHAVQPKINPVKKKGDIVVITAQAHAGVDNMALSLQRGAGLPIIRSASDSSKLRIASDLRSIHENRLQLLWGYLQTHHETGTGFVYLATNNGLLGDRRCFMLLQMYLHGAPMGEIEARYHQIMKTDGRDIQRLSRYMNDFNDRPPTRPIWGQEEAGQANVAETILVYYSLFPKKCALFGDHYQLPPHGFADDMEKTIQQALKAGLQIEKPLDGFLSEKAYEAAKVSLFERAYSYATHWRKKNQDRPVAMGISHHFLQVTRRSHWLIAQIIALFYKGLLKHRDHEKPRSTWEKIETDTILFIETSGQETNSGVVEKEWGEEGRTKQRSTSYRNFKEASEVVKTIMYYLNVKSQRGAYQYQPSDFMILTPYKAQNTLINEVLVISGILHDMAARQRIRELEKALLVRLIRSHLSQLRNPNLKADINQVLENILSSEDYLESSANQLLTILKPLYDLTTRGDRKIEREHVQHLFSASGIHETDIVKEGEMIRPDGRDTYDEQKLNVLMAKTVHRVQGQEKKVVVVSLVRNAHPGFMHPRYGGDQILNVAFSRAQEKLAIISSRGLGLERLHQIRSVLPQYAPGFRVLHHTPIPPNGNGAYPPASLRHAWDLTTGSTALDHHVDQFVMPPFETLVFLSTLMMGLHTGNVALIAAGFLIQLFLFPALHVLAKPGDYQWRNEFLFSGKILLAYLLTWLVLTSAAPGYSHAILWPSLILPTFLHARRNSSSSPKTMEELLPVQKAGVDSVGGLTDIVLDQIPSASTHQRVHRMTFDDIRIARSGT